MSGEITENDTKAMVWTKTFCPFRGAKTLLTDLSRLVWPAPTAI